ncbi:MAG: hypothetical protein ACKO3P_19120, partial [Planctomycetaceae bacterium]
MNLNLASNVLREMGKVEEVAPLWRAALADADSAKATDPAGKSLVSDLRRGWVSKLLDNGAPFDEARSIMQTNLTEARADHEAQPEDSAAATR